jgi:hypothetical protein
VLFLCSHTLRLFDTSFISIAFTFVVVRVHTISSLHFPDSLQSFCFSVRLPGIFVLFTQKIIIPAFAHPRNAAIRTDRPHKIWN